MSSTEDLPLWYRPEEPIHASDIAPRAPRLTRALVGKGIYVPPRLLEEMTDALQAIAVKSGCLDSTDIPRLKVKIDTATKSVPGGGKNLRYEMSIRYNSGTISALDQIPIKIREYLKSRGIQNIALEEEPSHGLKLTGPQLEPLIAAFCDGYIAQVAPEFAVDYKAILAEGAKLGAKDTPQGGHDAKTEAGRRADDDAVAHGRGAAAAGHTRRVAGQRLLRAGRQPHPSC